MLRVFPGMSPNQTYECSASTKIKNPFASSFNARGQNMISGPQEQANTPALPNNDEGDASILHPGPYDILCDRDHKAFLYVGNRRFRVTCEMHVQKYMNSISKKEKSNIFGTIVKIVHSAGGMFLTKKRKTGDWEELSDFQAKEKIGHTLRAAVLAINKAKDGGTTASRTICAAIYGPNHGQMKKKNKATFFRSLPSFPDMSGLMLLSLMDPVAMRGLIDEAIVDKKQTNKSSSKKMINQKIETQEKQVIDNQPSPKANKKIGSKKESINMNLQITVSDDTNRATLDITHSVDHELKKNNTVSDQGSITMTLSNQDIMNMNMLPATGKRAAALQISKKTTGEGINDKEDVKETNKIKCRPAKRKCDKEYVAKKRGGNNFNKKSKNGSLSIGKTRRTIMLERKDTSRTVKAGQAKRQKVDIVANLTDVGLFSSRVNSYESSSGMVDREVEKSNAKKSNTKKINVKKNAQKKELLRVVVSEPGPNDVLCNRGRAAFLHEGNQRLRTICEVYAQKYNAATTKGDKGKLFSTILDCVHDEGGFFISKQSETEGWEQISTIRAKEKIGHSLRSAAIAVKVTQPTLCMMGNSRENLLSAEQEPLPAFPQMVNDSSSLSSLIDVVAIQEIDETMNDLWVLDNETIDNLNVVDEFFLAENDRTSGFQQTPRNMYDSEVSYILDDLEKYFSNNKTPFTAIEVAVANNHDLLSPAPGTTLCAT